MRASARSSIARSRASREVTVGQADGRNHGAHRRRNDRCHHRRCLEPRRVMVSVVRSNDKVSTAAWEGNTLRQARGCLLASGVTRLMHSSGVIVACVFSLLGVVGFTCGARKKCLGNTILVKLELWELVIVFNNNFYSATNICLRYASAKCGR